MSDSYDVGQRVKKFSGNRAVGTITEGIWSGYVTVKWDSGVTERDVHIRDIKIVDKEGNEND